MADGEVMAEVPVKVKTADGMTTIDAVMEAFIRSINRTDISATSLFPNYGGIETSNTLFFYQQPIHHKRCEI